MRSSTCSTEPMWVKVPRPSSAARVIRKLFGAEPMPTMNTRERPRCVGDGVEQLLLVADRAVGQEHDLPDMRGRRSAPRVGERRLASPAPSRCRRSPGARRRRPWRGRCSPRRPATASGNSSVHGVVEADDVEAVARLQAAEREDEARLGLGHRRAAHRAGIVDDEDDLARQRLLRRPASTVGGVTKASR